MDIRRVNDTESPRFFTGIFGTVAIVWVVENRIHRVDYVYYGVCLEVTDFAVRSISFGKLSSAQKEKHLRSFRLTDGHEEVFCVLHLELVKNVVLRRNSVPVRQKVVSGVIHK